LPIGISVRTTGSTFASGSVAVGGVDAAPTENVSEPLTGWLSAEMTR
jgi:hypothetical protein